MDVRRQDDVDAAGKRQAGFAGPQTLDRQMHGVKRGRTRCIERDRRTAQTENIGDTAGRRVTAAAERHGEVELVGMQRQPLLEIRLSH